MIPTPSNHTLQNTSIGRSLSTIHFIDSSIVAFLFCVDLSFSSLSFPVSTNHPLCFSFSIYFSPSQVFSFLYPSRPILIAWYTRRITYCYSKTSSSFLFSLYHRISYRRIKKFKGCIYILCTLHHLYFNQLGRMWFLEFLIDG